jgi:phosphoserine phosphatase/dolichol kinase
MGKRLNNKKRYRGLVVFDVDGVLFRSIFLIRIARTAGLRKYLKMVILGCRYYTNSITFEQLLRDSLGLLRGYSANRALEVARRIKLSENLTQTIEVLRKQGYYISLMSSGIPNFVLSQLAERIGAHHVSGLDVEVRDGTIDISNLSIHPKEETAEELLNTLGLTWNDVVSVVDDPNNMVLMRRSRVGIGFNPSRIIRRHADVVVDGYDMLEVLPHIVPEDRLSEKFSLRKQLLSRELYRKSIHFLGVPLPFVAYFHRGAVIILLSAVIVIYALSEIFRTIGFHFPFVSHITKRSERITETRSFIVGPVSLTAGILLTLLFFPSRIYIPAVLIVCISDSLSSLVGRWIGRVVLPFYERTLEGTATFYISSLIILLFFMPAPQAAVTALVPTFIELITPHYLDNLLIPVITAMFMQTGIPQFFMELSSTLVSFS